MTDKLVVDDIYYLDSYGKLYEPIERGEYCNFKFTTADGSIIHPFIKRPLPFLIDGTMYYDIVTPYGYGGPQIISLNESTERCRINLIKDFLSGFFLFCDKERIISEFIRFHPLLFNAEQMQGINGGYEIIGNRKTIAIDLLDLDFFMNQFESKCRNMVRKSEKLGVTIEVDEELESINAFIDIYYKTMLKDSADDYYFFSREYFDSIRDNMSGASLLVNATFENRVIASSLFFYIPGSFAHYHLSATHPEYYKLSANNLILKAACDLFQKKECTWLHLGGGLSGDEKDRLFSFKRSFGREEKNIKDFYIGKKIWNDNAYNKAVEIFMERGGEPSTYFPLYRASQSG